MTNLPLLLCGPSVRRCDEKFVWFWLLTSGGIDVEIHVFASGKHGSGQASRGRLLGQTASSGLQIGKNTALHLVKVACADKKEPDNKKTKEVSALRVYEVLYRNSAGKLLPLLTNEELQERLLPNAKELTFLLPRFKASSDAPTRFLAGSCRKIQTTLSDSSTRFTTKALELWRMNDSRPEFLVCCGDQIYADDVTATMWVAIRVIQEKLFGVFERDREFNSLSGNGRSAFVKKELTSSSGPYGSGPNAEMHLLTYTEFASLYILCWSPGVVRALLPGSFERLGDIELKAMNTDSVVWQKIFANTVSYFLLDDHESTDDFRIDSAWIAREQTSPRLRRFSGNALLSYLVFQALGNAPESFGLLQDSQSWAARLINGIGGDSKAATEIDEKLLTWKRWSYSIPNVAPVIVLDTRMGRNVGSGKKAGELQVLDSAKQGRYRTLPVLSTLMLSVDELKRCLSEVRTCAFKNSLVIITPTPIFGHPGLEKKIRDQIEVSADMAKWDYENWRSNPKSFKTLVETLVENSIYENIVVISGDIHCAFQATSKVSFGKKSLNFSQICSSPLANPIPSVARNLIPSIRHSDEYVSYFWERFGGAGWRALFGATKDSAQLIADLSLKYGPATWFEVTRFSKSEKSPSNTVLFFEPNIASVAISNDLCVSTLFAFDESTKPRLISKAIFPVNVGTQYPTC
jgi:hypothetical protein